MAVIKKENTSMSKYDTEAMYFNYLDKEETPTSFKKAAQS